MICDRLKTVKQKIHEAEQRYQRIPGSVQLLAVSKTKPAEAIRAAWDCGQRSFGENYAQELQDKSEILKGLNIEWHFIGPLQSNKTRIIAAHAHWIHSIEREKIARRLNDQRPDDLPPVNVCLQINISGETSKSGLELEEVQNLARQILELPRLRLRGLMTLPAPEQDFERQRAAFARVRELFEELKAQGMELDTLSMGMSGDLEAAIAEGATIVRIGTAIFGARDYPATA
jgi:pyridoxal phosphate enzyme (YggS family)